MEDNTATLVEVLRRIRYANKEDERMRLIESASALLGMEPAAALLHRIRFATPEHDDTDEEFIKALHAMQQAQRVDNLKRLGIPVTSFGPGPHPHVIVQVDGRTIDPSEYPMTTLERYQRVIQRVVDLFPQLEAGDPVEQLESLLDRNMIAQRDEPDEIEALLVLAQTALTPFAEHADRMETRCTDWDNAEPAAAVRDGLTLGDMRQARVLWGRIQDHRNESDKLSALWGVFAEKGQCWAKNGNYVLLFPTEAEAKAVADEWSDREPARRHNYVWLPRAFGEKEFMEQLAAEPPRAPDDPVPDTHRRADPPVVEREGPQAWIVLDAERKKALGMFNDMISAGQEAAKWRDASVVRYVPASRLAWAERQIVCWREQAIAHGAVASEWHEKADRATSQARYIDSGAAALIATCEYDLAAAHGALAIARNDAAVARITEEHTSKLLSEAREHIAAMRTTPPRRYALWDGHRGDWHKDADGVSYVWDHEGKAHDASVEFQRTIPEIKHFEVRPYETHYEGTTQASEPSLRTRVDKYWELRCAYFDLWRKDFDALQEAWRWVQYAQMRIAELAGRAP